MGSSTSPLAGMPATSVPLVDINRLVAAYYEERPDPSDPGSTSRVGDLTRTAADQCGGSVVADPA